MRKTLLTICMLSAFAARGPAQVQTTNRQEIPRLVASARGTVVLLKTFDRQGKVLGLGSGFRISGGRLVTNAHVVAGASRVEIFDDTGALLGIARSADMLSTTVDLAILPSVGPRAPYLSLARVSPAVGEQVIVIGAPEGLTNTVSDGIVSAQRKIGARQLLQISAPISPGSSGGPVLNTRGEVVGVSVAILREGQNLNFAVPVSDVMALVSSRTGQFEFPPPFDEIDQRSASRERSGSTSMGNMPFLSIGRNASGTLTAADQGSHGLHVDYYRLTGVAGTSVSIWVGSVDFDPMVSVYRFVGDSTVIVTSDDDSGEGLDGLRLSAKAILTFSADVTYVVAVAAADARRSQLGQYVVRVEPTNVAGQSSATSAGQGQSRWLPVGTSEGSRIEFDRTSITPSGYQVYLAWQRTTYRTPFKDTNGDTLDVVLLQTEVSCGYHRVRLRSGVKYLKGKVILSASSVDPWESTVPGSVGEAAARSVCAYAKANGI